MFPELRRAEFLVGRERLVVASEENRSVGLVRIQVPLFGLSLGKSSSRARNPT